MSNPQFYFAIGVILALLLVPLAVIILVRILIPLKEPDGEGTGEPPLEFTSLRDFWESNVPHLRELRDRLLKCIVAIFVGTAIGFALVYYAPVIDIILDQFIPENVQPQATGVAEEFVGAMRIALVIGVALTIPYVLYQIVAFIAPALHPPEKRALFTALPFVSELFLAGLAFGWFFTIPAATNFLLTVQLSDRTISQPTLSSILALVSTLLLWNGLIFELPAIVYLVARLGLVDAQTLARTRRYAIVVIVIFSAIITPTGDPYNLMLLAVPMYVLYELGILLARLVPKRRDKVEVEVVGQKG